MAEANVAGSIVAETRVAGGGWVQGGGAGWEGVHWGKLVYTSIEHSGQYTQYRKKQQAEKYN